MIILDTSFLSAYFRKSDFHHEKAISLAEKYQDETMIISFLVFQELISHINRKSGNEMAISVAQQLLSGGANIEIYKVDEAFMEEVMVLFERLKPHTFSYIDVSLIHLSREFEIPVLTFDKELEVALAQD